MTTERAPVTPTTDMPLSVAIEELTGFETIAIEKRFSAKMEELGGTSLMIGVVWAYENRDVKRSWASVEGMTLRELHGYFPEEPRDVDPDSPDSALGKASSAGAEPTNT